MSRALDSPARISEMSQTDLTELVKRLQSVLRNTKLLEKLDDRGQRIREKISAVENELGRREMIVKEASDQLDRMFIQDTANDSPADSAPESDEPEFPKFCMKLSEYEKHRIAKAKFKPFSSVNQPAMTPDNRGASESLKELRQNSSHGKLSTLSFEESLRIAAVKQNLTKRLFREDATTFALESAKEISFSQNYRPTEEFLKYRNGQENSDSDEESPDPGQSGNGLEELD